MVKIRAKVREIDAIQWTGDNPYEMSAFVGWHPSELFPLFTSPRPYVGSFYTMEYGMWLNLAVGDWIVKDRDNLVAMKLDKFEQYYEVV